MSTRRSYETVVPSSWSSFSSSSSSSSSSTGSSNNRLGFRAICLWCEANLTISGYMNISLASLRSTVAIVEIVVECSCLFLYVLLVFLRITHTHQTSSRFHTISCLFKFFDHSIYSAFSSSRGTHSERYFFLNDFWKRERTRRWSF